MEQFLLGIFQEQLSRYLVGFKKEQVNANLLNGKGQIRDVNLNCSFINENISKITPFFHVESIRVSELGFNVTSWTNLKKAPILVDIQDVEIKVVEPLSFLEKEKRLKIRQLSWVEFMESSSSKTGKRGPYNLFDRILDNLQVEIRSVTIIFQPMGRFKTHRKGPWTPPSLILRLKHLKYCSVDQYGNEGSIDDCWRHNSFEGNTRDQTLIVYKKVATQVSLGILSETQNTSKSELLLKDTPLEVHIAFHKKFIDSAILAIQIDVTFNRVEVHISKEILPSIVHTASGIQYCFSKDRAFEDPLLPHGDEGHDEGSVEVNAPKALVYGNMTSSVVESDSDEDDKNLSSDKNQGNSAGDDASDLTILGLNTMENVDNVGIFGVKEDPGEESKSSKNDQSLTPQLSSQSGSNDQNKTKARPVLVLPSGVVIYEKLSISLSIHDVKVRGTYFSGDDDYVQLHVKGLVTEVIWPKATLEKGLHAQLSLSYVTLQDLYDKKMTTLMRGGRNQGRQFFPLESLPISCHEIPPDDTFPFLEDRCIRPDHFDFRHSFPCQAVSLKASFNSSSKVSDPVNESFFVLLEVGIDRFEAILDSLVLSRVLKFLVLQSTDGYDPRWYSGDWTEELTTDILVYPSSPLILSNCIQGHADAFHHENEMISSDLMNITAKLSGITLRIPAAAPFDVRACDIILSMTELMLVVKADLPKSLFCDKIGSSRKDEESHQDTKVNFPNDPSDICYAIAMPEDRVGRQQLSTFRAKMTTKGLEIKLVPTLPYFNADFSRKLLAPLEMTILFCFEGDRLRNKNSDLYKINFSIQIHDLNLNLDFDLLAGALICILSHLKVFNTLKFDTDNFSMKRAEVRKLNAEIQDGFKNKMSTYVQGETATLEEQLVPIVKTPCFTLVLIIEIAEVGVKIWRQRVPLNSIFRASVSGDNSHMESSPIPIINLLTFKILGTKVGIETEQIDGNKRFVIKASIAEAQIKCCDFEKISAVHVETNPFSEDEEKTGEKHGFYQFTNEEEMRTSCNADVMLVSFGGKSGKDLLLRMEDLCDSKRSVSLDIDLGGGGCVNFQMHQLECLLLLFMEAMLMSMEIEHNIKINMVSSQDFPQDTVGALFINCFQLNKNSKNLASASLNMAALVKRCKSIDDLIRLLLEEVYETSLSQLFLRISMDNFVVAFPPDVAFEGLEWLAYQIRDLHLTSWYDRLGPGAGLWQRIAQQGYLLNEFCGCQNTGFYCCVRASNALCIAEHDGSRTNFSEPLIGPFEVCLSSSLESIILNLQDFVLSLGDFPNILLYCSLLSSAITNYKIRQERISKILSVFQISSSDNIQSLVKCYVVTSMNNGAHEAISDVDLCVAAGRRMLETLQRSLHSYNARVRGKILEQEQEIKRLNIQLFLKEQRCAGALALLSCQAAGWLRMGGTHMISERSPKISSMWKYYAVLRKSLLILYSKPGKSTPLDVVNLEGATVLSLEGGQRKRDIKNGFAIQERKGMVRYILAPNGEEYEIWLREIKQSITTVPNDSNDLGDESFDDAEASLLSADEVAHGLRSRSRTESSDIDGNDTKSLTGDSGIQKRSQILKQKLLQVTVSTKTTFGSAIQAAKQRGLKKSNSEDQEDDEVQVLGDIPIEEPAKSSTLFEEKPRHKNVDTSDRMESSALLSQASIFKTPTKDSALMSQSEKQVKAEHSSGKIFGNFRAQTKNKIGSALQGAREKALAIAEDRRRKSARDGIDDADSHLSVKGCHDSPAVSLKVANEKTETSPFPYQQNRDGDSRLQQSITPLVEVLDSFQDIEKTKGSKVALKSKLSNISRLSELLVDDGLPSEQNEDLEHEGIPNLSEFETMQTPVSGSVFRNQLAKIGSVVKTVQQTTQIGKGHAAFQSSGENEKNSRFRALYTRASRLHSSESSNLLALKSIRTGRSLEHEDDSSVSESSMIAKIKGNWTVFVKLGHSTEAKASSNRIANESFIVSKPYDTDGIEIDTLPTNEASTEDEVEPISIKFRVSVISQDPGIENDSKVLTIERSFQDMVRLVIDVIESINLSPQMPLIKACREFSDASISSSTTEITSPWGTSLLDTIMLSGDILGGLLTSFASFQDINGHRLYQCEVLSHFLNASLQSPLPIRGCMAVLEFLDIVHAGIMPLLDLKNAPPESMKNLGGYSESPFESEALMAELNSLSSSCINYMARAERSSTMAKDLLCGSNISDETCFVQKNESNDVEETCPSVEPIFPASFADELQRATHEALKIAMIERDEAQASLIASSVLHVHEIERERKQGELMKRKLQNIEGQANRLQIGGLFVDRSKDPQIQEAQRLLEHTVKKMEEEIRTLGIQLAQEVAEKTAAKLETYRLTELMNLMKASAASDKKALEQELQRTRKQLINAESKLLCEGKDPSSPFKNHQD